MKTQKRYPYSFSITDDDRNRLHAYSDMTGVPMSRLVSRWIHTLPDPRKDPKDGGKDDD